MFGTAELRDLAIHDSLLVDKREVLIDVLLAHKSSYFLGPIAQGFVLQHGHEKYVLDVVLDLVIVLSWGHGGLFVIPFDAMIG